MKAVVLHELEGPGSLSYEDVQDPEPGSGEIVFRLRNAALNRRDVFVTQGMYPGAKPDALPIILGSDGSGEVAAKGDGAEGPHEEAAAIPLGALTAYRALFTRGQLQEGETVLVPGIGGGVATFVVQMARAAGATVFVTSGSDEKIERAKEFGAEGGVNYNSEDWSKELKSMTGGVDLSVDSIGGEVFNTLIRLSKPGSRIVIFGATAGPAQKAMTISISLKNLDVFGTAMGNAQEFDDMLQFYEEHDLHPVINETFPLEDTAAAQQHMEEGKGIGKIVLEIPA